MKKKKACCFNWEEITDSIQVTAREFEVASEKYKADCVEKMLKWVIGNYCPTCGMKLRK